MNAPKKAEKKESKAKRYEQADPSTTSPVPPLANAVRPLGEDPIEPAERPDSPVSGQPSVASVEEPVEVSPVSDLPVAVLDSSRITNPIGLRAERAAARAAD